MSRDRTGPYFAGNPGAYPGGKRGGMGRLRPRDRAPRTIPCRADPSRSRFARRLRRSARRTRESRLMNLTLFPVTQSAGCAKCATRPVDAPTRFVGYAHPETSHAMQRRALPNTGTVRRRCYEFVAAQGPAGATDDEVQVALGLSHQSGSAAMSTLRRDGWLVRSGEQDRMTRWGNAAHVWTVAVCPNCEGLA